jgi:hypothetical protein
MPPRSMNIRVVSQPNTSPYTGLRPTRDRTEEFWRWYLAEFHGEDELARQRKLVAESI